MNTKGIKFLAVLAVLAMTFAAFAIILPSETDDAAESGPIKFGEDVTYSTSTTSNVKLGNAITVTTTAPSTGTAYYTYVITGVLAYDTQVEADSVWGMTDKKNVLVFNETLTNADNKLWIRTATTVSATPSEWSAVSSRLSTTTTEPWMIGCANDVYWIAETASTATEVTDADIVAKIVLDDSASDPMANIVKLTGGETLVFDGSAVGSADLSAAYDIVVTKSTTITRTVAQNKNVALNMTGAGKSIYVAAGATLTINMNGAVTTTTGMFTGIQFKTNVNMIGLGDNAKIEINDTTTKGTWTTGMTSYGIHSTIDSSSTSSVFKNLTIKYAGAGENTSALSAGLGFGGTAVEFNKVKFDIEAGNRGIYGFNGSDITIKNSSSGTITAGESAIKADDGITVGTSSDSTDKTDITVKVNDKKADTLGNKAVFAMHAKADSTICEGATVTADAVLMRGANLTVDGTLVVKGSDSAGYTAKKTQTGHTDEDLKYTPGGLVVGDTVEDKVQAFAGSKKLTLGSTGTVTVKKGAAILAYVSDGQVSASIVQFGTVYTGTATTEKSQYQTYPIIAGSDLTLTYGSVQIEGDFTKNGDGSITVTGTVEISGTLDVPVTATNNAVINVPAGKTLTIGNDGGITTANVSHAYTINVVGDLNGKANSITAAGADKVTVYAADATNVGAMIESGKGSVKDPSTKSATALARDAVADLSPALLQEFFNNNFNIDLTENLLIAAGEAITIPDTVTLNLNGYNIIIQKAGETVVAGELIVEGAKILDYKSTAHENPSYVADAAYINVNGILTIDAADVCVNVNAIGTEMSGYVSIKNAKNMNIGGALTSDLSVGYGNTMTLNDVTIPSGKNVYAYGSLVFTGTTNAEKNSNIYMYKYGTTTVSGTLNIAGYVKADNYVNITGKVTVSNDNGGAILDAANGTIDNDGTFEVIAPRSSSAVLNNTLIAGNNTGASVPAVINDGTMKITGKVSGVIYDCADLTFNGTSDNATVILTDGVTFKVTSVAGTLTVKDDDTARSFPSVYPNLIQQIKTQISAGNQAVITDVKNITFTESVAVSIKEGTWAGETTNITVYVATLQVSGTVTAVDEKETSDYETVALTGTSTWKTSIGTKSVVTGTVATGKVNVSDLTIGKNVKVTLNSNVKVTGALTATAKTSLVVVSSGAKVPVTGLITIGNENGKTADPQGILADTNSVFYEVQDEEAKSTYYYSSFVDAVSVSEFVYDKLLRVYGSNTVSSGDVVIPADVTVQFQTGASMTVKAAATVTVSADAVLNSTAGSMTIDGILLIMDKNTGFKYTTITYQVYTENGDVAAYSGFLGAIKYAESGDVITIQQPVTIKESFVIPEGVKVIVPAKVTVTIGSSDDKVKVDNKGTLEIQRTASLAKAAGAKEVILAISGVMTVDAEATFAEANFTVDDYAYFEGKIDGRATHFYSNLTYALENCHEGTITGYGKISAGDVSLVKGEYATGLELKLSGTAAKPAVMNVNSLTLDGSKITVANNNQKFTGTIIAADALGYAKIDMDSATGFVAESGFTVESTGNVYYLYLKGNGTDKYDGSITIAEGIVTMNGDMDNANSADAYLKVSSGAVFIILGGKELTTSKITGQSAAHVIIAGMMTVCGTLDVDKNISVSGALYVAKSKATDEALVEVGANVTVTGTLNVDEDDVLGDGRFVIGSYGKLTVGTAAKSVGATATVVGPISIDDNGAYILAYPGCDLSEAKIEWNSVTESSDAVYTDVYVYDVLFVTEIAKKGTTVGVIGTAITDKTSIAGLNVADCVEAFKGNYYEYWFTDAAMKKNLYHDEPYRTVGYYDELYFGPKAAEVSATVTVGAGLYLYIDGIAFTATDVPETLPVGTHTVYTELLAGYDGDSVKITFNGTVVPVTASGAIIVVDADMDYVILAADGAVPHVEPVPEPVTPEEKSEWTVTTILLCVLVVLIAIMAVIVALRLNRN